MQFACQSVQYLSGFETSSKYIAFDHRFLRLLHEPGRQTRLFEMKQLMHSSRRIGTLIKFDPMSNCSVIQRLFNIAAVDTISCSIDRCSIWEELERTTSVVKGLSE